MLFLLLSACVVEAGTPFNIVPSKTIFVIEGDSESANQGQNSWVYPYYSNLMVNAFGPFVVMTNVAQNGDFINDVGITAEYASEVRIWTNSAYTNVLALWIGANNGLTDPGNDSSNYIFWKSNYMVRATNDGWNILNIPIAFNFHCTNAAYLSNLMVTQNWDETNKIQTWFYPIQRVFNVTTISNTAIMPDGLHFTIFGASTTGTNTFLLTSTNIFGPLLNVGTLNVNTLTIAP